MTAVGDRNPRVLLVGTQRGLFRVSGGPGTPWRIEGPLIEGYEILHAWLHPADPRVGYAAAYHAVWGAHVYRTTDAGLNWTSLSAAPAHTERAASREALKSIWYLAPASTHDTRALYAGIDPPGLFESRDEGAHWSPVVALNAHRTRSTWEPARGGFAVHSIQVDPLNEQRVYAAVSAGGAYRSDDGGASWRPINRGVRAENLPASKSNPVSGHNVHRLLVHPGRPARLYRQCYTGTFRSDDYGETWTEITAGLPGAFGYAIVSQPRDPDTVYVVPHESPHMRVNVGGRLRVYRSRDAGAHWTALTSGLPQQHVYVTVLREAMACDAGESAGVYFGTTGGHLFASLDGGDSWEQVAGYLPRIMSVQVCLMPT